MASGTPNNVVALMNADELYKLGAKFDKTGTFRKNTQFKEGEHTPDSFYFRLAGTKLYYAENDTCTNILGVVDINYVETSVDKRHTCFMVQQKKSKD
jgi:hypothetical protein